MRFILVIFIITLCPLAAQADVCMQWAIISFPSAQEQPLLDEALNPERSEITQELETHYVREARMVADCKTAHMEGVLELEDGQEVVESGCECLDD